MVVVFVLFKACADSRADVAFLLDSSGSIGSGNWEVLKSFVIHIIDNLVIQANHTRLAIVRFSSSAEIIFDLRYIESRDFALVKKKIYSLAYLAGGTNTAAALRLMRVGVFSADVGDRPDIRNIGVIITDGRSRSEDLTKTEAIQVKQEGIRMFSIGLTDSINEAELKTIASQPPENHYFTEDQISDVETLRTRLVWGVCNKYCTTGKLIYLRSGQRGVIISDM